MITLKMPDINGKTLPQQVEQLKTYLYEMAGYLQVAVSGIQSGEQTALYRNRNGQSGASEAADDPLSTFNSIKGLIIKSADIVKEYYEKIDELLKLSGEYVAEATFPGGSATFVEQTEMKVSANSSDITQAFADIQAISGDLAGLKDQVIQANAWIKSGLLSYDANGAPVYGVEVGQINVVDGEEVFNKYAQFTAEKLSFFDQSGQEVAYVSDRKLYITNAHITGKLRHGGFEDTVMPNNGGTVTKWVGGT